MGFEIRLLGPADAQVFKALRLQALSDAPLAFSEALTEAQDLSDDAWRKRIEETVILGLFLEDRLAGMVQIDRYASAATRHRAWIGALFVDSSLRGKGAGKALIDAAIDHSQREGILQLHLGVGDFNTGALGLYESCGFVRYGTQPRGLYANGQYVDEHLLALRLDR